MPAVAHLALFSMVEIAYLKAAQPPEHSMWFVAVP
jgi:hypothetical protein